MQLWVDDWWRVLQLFEIDNILDFHWATLFLTNFAHAAEIMALTQHLLLSQLALQIHDLNGQILDLSQIVFILFD